MRTPAGWCWASPFSPARAAAIVGGFAVLFRLLLLDTAPSLSDDIYRYLWDARVQAAGGNPYAHAPDAAPLEGLRDEDWSRINHPELVTVYPPVAQWFFLAAHLVWPGVTGLKAALVLCDLLLIAVLWRLLRVRGQRPERALLYAWHRSPQRPYLRTCCVTLARSTLSRRPVTSGRSRSGLDTQAFRPPRCICGPIRPTSWIRSTNGALPVSARACSGECRTSCSRCSQPPEPVNFMGTCPWFDPSKINARRGSGSHNHKVPISAIIGTFR